MSISGLCQICEARRAQEQCENCGNLVCEQHYETGQGLCADCATQARPGESDEVDINRL